MKQISTNYTNLHYVRWYLPYIVLDLKQCAKMFIIITALEESSFEEVFSGPEPSSVITLKSDVALKEE